MTTTSMVVMEPGSDWPGQIGDSTSLVAFCQEGVDLVCRTRAKLGAEANRLFASQCSRAIRRRAAQRLATARKLLACCSLP
jgi:hypothetical protein